MEKGNLKFMKDWVAKGYHCAYCGTDKSVKYFGCSTYGDIVPLCNRCVMKNTLSKADKVGL